MPYPTSQASPLMLLAALQQQQQIDPANPYGANLYGVRSFNPASLAPAQLPMPQRGQSVAGGMGGGMGQIPVLGGQNGSGGTGGLAQWLQLANAMKSGQGNQNVGGLLDFSGNPMSTASGYGNAFGSVGDWFQRMFGSGTGLASSNAGWATNTGQEISPLVSSMDDFSL